MPVIENLKNLIHRNHNRSASASNSSTPNPSESASASHRKSRSGGGAPAAPGSASGSGTKTSSSTSRIVPQQPTVPMPVPPAVHAPAHQHQHQHPPQQQHPQRYDGYATGVAPAAEPELVTYSGANQFAAPNPVNLAMDHPSAPAATRNMGGGAGEPSGFTPVVQHVGGGAVASHGEAAAVMIEKARKERGKMPVYQGLPEHFVLLEKMGDGAFSNVYKAVDRRTGQKVAIKCVRKYELTRSQGKHLNADLKKKPRATERGNILKEVSIMRTLNHPSIVKLLSFTESREHYFLVLELMEGGELFHQIVRLTYFSEELARHVILQVARGIRYLHEEKGVVHRDIKPENLLFEAIPIIPSKHPKARPYDEEKEDEGEFVPSVGGGGIGQVKIADFGLSKIVWAEDTATPCGTVGYTAPEIVKDERYSKSVDMWAMGCVLYTLLCGFPPFFDESIQVLTEKVARGYYTFLSPWWDDISASSKDLIKHLLCVDPEKRYTIDEFLNHPWCKEKAQGPSLNKSDLATLAPHVQRARRMNYAPLDSPLLQTQGGGLRTPGLHQLKEAFDITYAVHRMEEEGARRTRAGGPANPGVLHGLNEEDEDGEDGEHGGAVAAQEENRRRYGQEVSQAIEDQRLKSAALRGGRADPATTTASVTTTVAPAQEYQGWGGANRDEAEAALYGGRAGTRDRGGNRTRGFELNLAHATLLGRRKPASGEVAGAERALVMTPVA